MSSSRKKKKGKLNQASGAEKKKLPRKLMKMILPTDSDPLRLIVNYQGIKGRNCLYYNKLDDVHFDFPAVDTITSICPFPVHNIKKYLTVYVKETRKSKNFASKGQRQIPLSAGSFHQFWQHLVTTEVYQSHKLFKWELNIKKACAELLEIQNPNTADTALTIDEFLMQFSKKGSPARWRANLDKLAEMTLPVPISMQEEDLTIVTSSEVEKCQHRKRKPQEEKVHVSPAKKQRSAGEEAKEDSHLIKKAVSKQVCSETASPKPVESEATSAASSHSTSAATLFSPIEAKKEVGQPDHGMDVDASAALGLVNHSREIAPFGTVPRLGLFSNPLVANADDIFDQNMQEEKESDNSPQGEPLSFLLQAPVIFDSEERRPADDYWHTEAEASLIPHSMFYSSLLQKPQYRPEQDIGHSQLPTDEANTAGTTLDKR